MHEEIRQPGQKQLWLPGLQSFCATIEKICGEIAKQNEMDCGYGKLDEFIVCGPSKLVEVQFEVNT